MSTVFKAYTAIFLVLMAVFISVGILSVQMDTQNARDYHASVVNEIENSNHSPTVIQVCKDEARANGYELEVVVYENTSGNYTFVTSKVTLKYQYTINFLGIQSQKEVIGYAR